MLFRKWGCLVGPENSIYRKLKSVDRKKKAFDHGNHFTLLFSLQSISGKLERERERARVRSRSLVRVDHDLAGKYSSRRWLRSRRHEIASLIAISQPDRDRDRTGSRSRSRLREIAPNRDRRRRDLAKIAISPSWDRTRSRLPSSLREIAPSIAISRLRSCEEGEITIVPSIVNSDRDRRRVVGRRDLGCGLCFSGFVFSFFFSKHQKIFFEKFFKMQPNNGNIFIFQKLAFPKNMYFPKNVLQQSNTA